MIHKRIGDYLLSLKSESSIYDSANSSFVNAGLKLNEILKFFLHILKILNIVLASFVLQIITPEPLCRILVVYSNSNLLIIWFNIPSLKY